MEEDSLQVRERAIRLLARREHSRLELRQKLVQKGQDGDLIEEVLDELAEEGLQSDRRYAEAMVNSRIGRGQGPLKIRSELGARGIEDELIEEALAVANADWRDLAASVRYKRFGETLPADYPEKTRQARFLSGRGFASDTIWQVLGGED